MATLTWINSIIQTPNVFLTFESASTEEQLNDLSFSEVDVSTVLHEGEDKNTFDFGVIDLRSVLTRDIWCL